MDARAGPPYLSTPMALEEAIEGHTPVRHTIRHLMMKKRASASAVISILAITVPGMAKARGVLSDAWKRARTAVITLLSAAIKDAVS